MQQIVNFILRNKTLLLFFLLFSIAMSFTIQSHSYHKSKFINSANFLSGGLYRSVNTINDYFDLKTQNSILQEENKTLRNIIYSNGNEINQTYIDSISYGIPYKITSAKVLKNSYALTNNVLTINKGAVDSIKQDFGVITSKGILGIIDNTSSKYATVISILNTRSPISAQLKKTNHFGTLSWDAVSPQYIQLTDIPKIAPIIIGDTIITSGRSSIFPKGIHIGIIEGFILDNAENYYEINVKLFNDMTSIEHVYIIENQDKNSLNILENPINE